MATMEVETIPEARDGAEKARDITENSKEQVEQRWSELTWAPVNTNRLPKILQHKRQTTSCVCHGVSSM